ncbi:2-oxo acid dehydrogenase subunit E2 [Spongiibacter nanhainus]|uniref:2-oxo acid dehydrogenase subunit E2 n=1 Tax=Spongiibacter nanhainus TaxID=2794344 RepID=A0A7T4URM3_9GAMM|nr:2-oxo acid dehydrogenase subunit E2 [Spongiibacter nanhainus]QQD19968.1 2-oxo acid dehydrogenase subunit E2 [Spongiibacter nanhainus]
MSFLLENIENSADWPLEDNEKYGASELVELSRIQSVVGKNLHRNWLAIPHVTHNEHIVVDSFFDAKTDGVLSGVSFLASIVKATAVTLKEFPRFNASIDAKGRELSLKEFVNIGVAVDTEYGLFVPVVQHCDTKSMVDISEDISIMAGLAKEKKLSFEKMQGGTFTISSLGSIGGVGFTPIINAPQVAILGASSVFDRPVRLPDDTLGWEKCLPVSLSYDHRIINGADAARFCKRLEHNFKRLLGRGES